MSGEIERFDPVQRDATPSSIVWIDGKVRSDLHHAEQAIGAYLGFDEATGLSEDERCEFVRDNLSLVASTAARNRLRELGAGQPTFVIIDAGDLPRSDGRMRQTGALSDRRKAERRQAKTTAGIAKPERRNAATSARASAAPLHPRRS